MPLWVKCKVCKIAIKDNKAFYCQVCGNECHRLCTRFIYATKTNTKGYRDHISVCLTCIVKNNYPEKYKYMREIRTGKPRPSGYVLVKDVAAVLINRKQKNEKPVVAVNLERIITNEVRFM
jgi:hypothetical protein